MVTMVVVIRWVVVGKHNVSLTTNPHPHALSTDRNAAEDMHPATSAADAPHPPSHDDATHTMATSTLRAAHATNANRKRKLVVDVVDGRPAVDLDGRHMRALMVDRAPLLTKRGWGARGGQQHTNNKAYGPQSLLVELVGGNTAMCDPRSSSGDHNGDAGTQANRRLLERPGMLGAAAPVLLALFDGMVQLPGVHPTRKVRWGMMWLFFVMGDLFASCHHHHHHL